MTLSGDTIDELNKKGRKPKSDNYFDEREETAVRLFLSANTFEEKNKIYNQALRKPLDKMISSIIRRYKLYRKDMDFQEIHADTHSFLMTKIEKFKPSKEKKAYSYFGTICKNYLMGQIIKDQKDVNRKISYEDISSDLENEGREDLIYYIEDDNITSNQIIDRFLDSLVEILQEKNLSENERKLGESLYEVFLNYDTIFISTDNNKFNKNIILLSLREMTNLSTKEIRACMKKYKKLYFDLIQNMVR
jgi:predicted SprT family Zn-dependent metalloprotease